MAALGPLPAGSTGLRWSFLLAAPVLASVLLLAGAYGVGREKHWQGASRVLTLASALFILLGAALAAPLLVFPRLPPTTARLVMLSRLSGEDLGQQAMTLPSPRQRLEAALGLYLRTGRPVMFLDRTGNPAIFSPDAEEASRLALPRWLASRPGVLPGERRLLALMDVLLMLIVLGGLPLVIRRRASLPPAPGPFP